MLAKDLLSYDYDWVVAPEHLIDKALRLKLISRAEARSRQVRDAAHDQAVRIMESWPEGAGFGSSDMNHVIHSMLKDAGIPVDWVRNRLTRIG